MADSQRKTANLYDGTTSATNARLSTSGTGTYAVQGWSVSSYIPINPSTNYCTNLSTQSYYCLYNENKGFLVGGVITKANPSSRSYADAKFIRFDFQTDRLPEVQLSEGTTGQDYEPYGWQHSLRKLGTATDTLTTLPADLYADGNNATVGLVGNMSQTGTPTPQNPIMPQSCGERTENLFDYQSVAKGKYIDSNGVEQTTSSSGHEILNHSGAIAVSPNTAYTFKIRKAESVRALTNAFCWFDTNNQIISRDMAEFAAELIYIEMTFTAPANAKYLIINFRDNYYDTGMVVEGSTAKPYEPYGYKIPISSANTTTPVYLGEVESTRKVKKVVLTGNESYVKDSVATYLYYTYVSHMYHTNCLCSHLKSTLGYPITQEGCSTYNNASFIYLNFGSTVMNAQTSGNTVAGLKEYLAAQYAAGTPVTVWCVLATEETGIVNEPIRKIGDYADSISGITIPTITGADSFDVLTTLKPSEVNLTYTGWHDATVEEWDGSEWQ